jgi:putative FmdB family regulatory protein
MPIYEYECRGCGNQFEVLVLPNRPSSPKCPECEGEDLERVPTGFAVNSPELSKARVKKAREARKASRNFKDQQVAEREHLIEHVSEHQERVRNTKT